MALFSFQSRFRAPILAGTKRQTIRRPRKNPGSHGKPGGPVTLVTGSRFKPERLGASTVTQVSQISLNFALSEVTISVRQGAVLSHLVFVRIQKHLDAFAVSDGFEDWADLCAFWAHNHPGLTLFEGIITKWGDLDK